MDFQVFYVHVGRDGKLARMEMFFTREQALEAAGAIGEEVPVQPDDLRP